MIKKYLDIEVIYEGDRNGKSMYQDWKSWNLAKKGIIGILSIDIDIENKKWKEIDFRQLNTSEDIIGDFSMFDLLGNCDLIVTWNGRDFDIPIINKTFKCRQLFFKRNRDLMDICLYNSVRVNGGLGSVVKRLGIDNLCSDKDVLNFYEHLKNIFNEGIDKESREYKDSLSIIMKRNEFDVRTLPLVEEKMNLLYELRLDIDRFHKRWY